MTASLPLCRSQKELGVTSARVHVRVKPRRCRLLLHVLRRFHRLHSELGQMINATAVNAVPVLEDVHVGTTQEWSLRLNVPQLGKTHQVLIHSKD